MLQALDASGLPSNTIVVFTSDNGGERFSKVRPFSGMKREFARRWHSHSRDRAMARTEAPGPVSEQVTITMDWMPTLLLPLAQRRTQLIHPMGRTSNKS